MEWLIVPAFFAMVVVAILAILTKKGAVQMNLCMKRMSRFFRLPKGLFWEFSIKR
jgi:hypothetical protein